MGNSGLSLDEKIGNSPPVYQLILNKKKTKQQTPATIAGRVSLFVSLLSSGFDVFF